MDIQKNGFFSIEQLTDRYFNGSRKSENTEKENGLSFQEILNQKSKENIILAAAETEAAGELKFSKHAAGRLAQRNIELSTSQLERLKNGTKKAGQKGIRDSLVIVDELAFIVNVPNKTVITAMDSTETDENVFTNINGAVII